MPRPSGLLETEAYMRLKATWSACAFGQRPRLSLARAQGHERIEYQSIEIQALAKGAFAGAKCPLRRDADLVDAALAWRRLDNFNQLRHRRLKTSAGPIRSGRKAMKR